MRPAQRIMVFSLMAISLTEPLRPQARLGENSETVGPQIAAASEQIRQHPRDANAWVTRAYYYLKPAPSGSKPPMKNAELAIQDLETAIKLDPKNYFARHNYAHAAYLFDFDNFAILEFNKALALNPHGARSYLGRGWAYYQSCKLNEAADDFEQAVRKDASLRGEIATPQKIQNRRQECAILAEQARRAALQPPPRPAGPNLGQWYEREQAAGRANAADAAGNHEGARVIRESMP